MVLLIVGTIMVDAPPAEHHSSENHSMAFLHEEPFAGIDSRGDR
jgi:hypothetical protein